MYEVDALDRVQPLVEIPHCDAGAPEPVVVADERSVVVAYYAPTTLDWNTAMPEDLDEEEIIVLRFKSVRSMVFGSPNDEALHGHPLAGRGLQAYAAHRVENSSWVRRLERMNRVHDRHNPDAYSQLNHVILTFHDSTFECVCRSLPDVSRATGTTSFEAALASRRRQE
jgi:hypothetical protein